MNASTLDWSVPAGPFNASASRRQATDPFAKEAYLLVVADGVSGRGLLTGSAGNETEGAFSAPAAGKTVAGSVLVAVACAALPVGSWAVGMAGGG